MFRNSLAALFMIGSAASAQAAVYDALGDFSIASNPNGPWSYGEGIAGSTFSPFVNAVANGTSSFWQSSTPAMGTPIVLKNTSGNAFFAPSVVFPTNVLIIHPGPVNDVIVRFTAPSAGIYNYSGLFEILDYQLPAGVRGLIFHNGTSLFNSALIGAAANNSTLTPGASIAFSGSVTLALGDNLSFAVNNGGNYTYDSTGFSASISSGVPELSTWAMMLIGFAGLGAAGARKRAADRSTLPAA